FTMPLLAAYHSLDAKFTTTDLARKLKSWALFGPPLGRTWQPSEGERQNYPDIRPLVSNPWTILHAEPPPRTTTDVVAVDLPGGVKAGGGGGNSGLAPVPAWTGTLLPESDGDIWLTSAFAAYERLFAREKMLRGKDGKGALRAADRERLAVDLFSY